MGVFRFDRFAWLSWLVRPPVTWTHEVSLELLVEHFDLSEPLARCGADPARGKSPRRKAVMLGQRGAIHMGGNQCVRVHRFLDGNAANERRNSAWDFIESPEHHMLSRRFHSRPFEQVVQPWSGESSRADRALLPLHARDFWI